MEKTGKILAITITSVLFLSGMLGVYANAGNEGEPGGCTPGYWKNHLDAWIPTGIEPTEEVDDRFIVPYTDLENKTLLQALKFKGGRGLEGAARILLRTAVAAILNDAHPDIEYQFDGDVIVAVNNALASDNRTLMLDLKDDLDYLNNLGCGVCNDLEIA